MFKRKKVFCENEYLGVVQNYFDAYVEKFFNIKITADGLNKVFHFNQVNERYCYPKYFLWIYNNNIYQAYLNNKFYMSYMLYGADILVNMLDHPLYCDIHLDTLVDILNVNYNIVEMANRNSIIRNFDGIPNESLRKFIWQPVVDFKVKNNLYAEDRQWLC